MRVIFEGTVHIIPTLLGTISSSTSLLLSLLCRAQSLFYPIFHPCISGIKPLLSVSQWPHLRGSLSSPAYVQGIPGASQSLPSHFPRYPYYMFSFPLLPPQPHSDGTWIIPLVKVATGAVTSHARMPQSHSLSPTRGRGEVVMLHPWLPAELLQECHSPRY